MLSAPRRATLIHHLNDRFGPIAETAYPAIDAIEAGEPSRPVRTAYGDVHPAVEVARLLELGAIVHLGDDDGRP